jgi:hypothetical protein
MEIASIRIRFPQFDGLDLVFDTGKVAVLQHGFERIRQNAGFEVIAITHGGRKKPHYHVIHPQLLSVPDETDLA